MKQSAKHRDRDYPFPIPGRDAVLALMSKHGEPMTFETITQNLGLHEKHEIEAFTRRLRAMERDGQILRNRRGHYGLIDKMDMICGRIIGHADGYGFLEPEGGGDDLFLPANAMRQVLHGDKVVARVSGVDARGRKEGRIVEVLERGQQSIIGRYVFENKMGFVIPEDRRIAQDIFIPPDQSGGAHHGQIVSAEITEYPTRRYQPIGRVTEVLGEHKAPGMEIEVAIRKYGIPHRWPTAAIEEAGAFGAEVPEEDKRDRTDIRRLPLVTIDGEDARDFDDAVYCDSDKHGWRLVVAIADVSHYVGEGNTLDQEAYQRGNSVYFPQHVIPMLPEALSNNLCSLNPKVDRLCMACDITITTQGQIKKYQFYRAVMQSHARLTYTKVAAMLVDGDAALRQEYAGLLPPLEALYRLYQLLHKVRMQRGAVDFELPETRIVFDKSRKIERIVALQRNNAHRLIEECMLAANVCAAEFLKKHRVPAPYRIHEGPTPEKLADLREFLFELGLSLGGGDQPQAKDYSKLIASVSARTDARLIQTVLLRSLSQAVYSPDNIGHFALGYDN
jgi:ribonuclease R